MVAGPTVGYLLRLPLLLLLPQPLVLFLLRLLVLDPDSADGLAHPAEGS